MIYLTYYYKYNSLPPKGGSWKGVPMPHDQAYYEAEKKIEEA